MVCDSGRCDNSWVAKAAGWTVTSTRKWYCPACTAHFERVDQNLIDRAQEFARGACLEIIASQPTQPLIAASAAAVSFAAAGCVVEAIGHTSAGAGAEEAEAAGAAAEEVEVPVGDALQRRVQYPVLLEL